MNTKEAQDANSIFPKGDKAPAAGQILICTDSVGYYQEKGKHIQTLHPGDVVKIFPGIEHWHSASPDSRFTHIAININTEKGIVNWLRKVTDEEYNSK